MVKIVLGGKKPPAEAMVPMTNMGEDIGSISRRLKVIEERYNNLRGRFQVTEQNTLQRNKNFFTDIKTVNLEMTEIKKEINELKDKMVVLIKELDSFAKKESVDILKKYIDLWAPINFVTKNDVEAIVGEVIDRMRRG